MAHSGLKKTTSARKKSREGGALNAEARCDENKPLEPYEIIRWYQQYLSAVINSLIEQVSTCTRCSAFLPVRLPVPTPICQKLTLQSATLPARDLGADAPSRRCTFRALRCRVSPGQGLQFYRPGAAALR